MDVLSLINVKSYNSLLQDTITRTLLCVIVLLSFIVSYYLSILAGFLLIASYVSGIIFFTIFCSENSPYHMFNVFGKAWEKELEAGVVKLQPHNRGCNICSDVNCKREKPTKETAPWQGLLVPREVDQAIQDLYNKILNEFISNWYRQLTKDENFMFELRKSLRFASCVFLRKVLETNLIDLITDRLITTGFSHLNDYLAINDLSKSKDISIEKAAVQYLGPRLHPAVKNRNAEVQYLRGLTDNLLNNLMDEKNLQCQTFRVLIREILAGWVLLPISDTLSDPYIINSLLMLALSHEPLTKYDKSQLQLDEFLRKFVAPPKNSYTKKSPLYIPLNSILQDQKLRFSFQQFLKKENAINILQFVSSFEEFSKKMFPTDLDKSDLTLLHKDAWDLFSLYFNQESPDSLHFSDHLVAQMEQVLKGGPENASKLRTCRPLFQAYDEAFCLLEETWCPLFHQSDEYFNIVCGERNPTGYVKQSNRPEKKLPETGGLARLKAKVQKILQTNPVEGSTFYAPLDVGGTAEEFVNYDEEENQTPDLSNWHVRVPSVFIDHSKQCPIFLVHSQKIASQEQWSVKRTLNDFYILQAKLTEFHSEFTEIPQLPQKRERLGERTEDKRKMYENFLLKLVKQPTLRGSSLVYKFLSVSGDFSSAIVETEIDGIGKLLKRSVQPIKLRKERGQHLDKFLSDYLASTEGHKKTGKYEFLDINCEPKRETRCLTSTIFKDNFKEYLIADDYSPVTSSRSLVLNGPWDCILFVLYKVMKVSMSVLQLFVTIKSMLGSAADILLKRGLDRTLRRLLVPIRMAYLVRLLQGALFSPKSTIKPNLYEEVEQEINNLKQNWVLSKLVPGFKPGLITIVDCLQQPLLNKHLSYCLLDEIAKCLYPDLNMGIPVRH